VVGKKENYEGTQNITAFNATDGSLIWTKHLGDLEGTPLIDNGDYIYINVYNSGAENGIYKLNKTKGSIMCENHTCSAGTAQSMAQSDNLIFDGCLDGMLYAYNKDDCTVNWSYTVSGLTMVPTTPLYWEDTVTFGAYGGSYVTVPHFIQVNASTGAHIWNKTGYNNAWDIQPSVKDGVIYMASAFSPYVIGAFNFSTGELIWGRTDISGFFSQMAIYDNRLWAGGRNKKIYSLNLDDGTTNCTSYDTDGDIYQGPSIVPGLAFFGSKQGNVMSMINTTDCSLVWSYDINAAVYSAPAISKGILYFAADDYNVWAFDVGNGTDEWSYLGYNSSGQSYCADCLTEWQYIKTNCSDIANNNMTCTVTNNYDHAVNVTLDKDNLKFDWYNSSSDLVEENSANHTLEMTSSATETFTLSITELTECFDITGAGIFNLAEDIYDYDTDDNMCFHITSSNVILDCHGHTVDGTGYGNAIYSIGAYGARLTNITIKNCAVNDSNYGIYIKYTDNYSVYNSSATYADRGIFSERSDNGNFSKITASSNFQDGLYFGYLSDYNTVSSSSFINNTYYDIYYSGGYCHSEFSDVNGTDNKPIVFYNSSVIIQGWNNNVSEIILCNADNSVIDNITMSHSDLENNGMLLVETDNTNVTNSVFNDSYSGVGLTEGSNYNILDNITANSNSQHGLFFDSSDHNTLSNIIANFNYFNGVDLDTENSDLFNITANSNSRSGLNFYYNARSNTLSNITASSNSYYGLYLYARSSTLNDSVIQDNTNYGIYMSSAGSEPNSIYNNLFNNTNNFYFTGTIYSNNWNTTNQTGGRIYSEGTQIGGNYWTNPTGTGYSDTCTDANTNGFCDVQYNLTGDGKNIDYLPLSDEYSGNAAPDDPSPDLVSVDGTNMSSSNLNCSATITDTNSDSMNVTVRWYNDNNLELTKHYNNSYPDGTSFYAILESGNLSENDIWKCGMRLYDSSLYSNWGNSNELTILDMTIPQITIISPTNTTYTTMSVDFNISANENLSYCKFTLDNWANNYTMTINASSTGANYTNSSIADGSYTAEFWCNDTSNNINNTEIVVFKIDTTSPEVTAINPSASETMSSTSVNYQFNVTDESPIKNCSLILDNSTVAYNSSPIDQTGGTNTITYTTSSGSHSYYINCTDSVNHKGNSSTISFTVSTADGTDDSSNTGSTNSPIFSLSQEQLEKGYEKVLHKNWRIRFKFENETHELKVDKIQDDKAEITISSSSEFIKFNISINETKKFNLDNDDYNDLNIFLKDINSYSGADLFLKFIHEGIIEEQEIERKEETEKKIEKKIEEKIKENRYIIILILLVVVTVSAAVVIIRHIRNKRKKNKRKK